MMVSKQSNASWHMLHDVIEILSKIHYIEDNHKHQLGTQDGSLLHMSGSNMYHAAEIFLKDVKEHELSQIKTNYSHHMISYNEYEKQTTRWNEMTVEKLLEEWNEYEN